MNGLAESRLLICRTCRNRRTAYAGVWDWPHCVFEGGDVELSQEYLEMGTCPAGAWDGLLPIDQKTKRAAEEAQAFERAKAFAQPYLDAALSRIPDDKDKAAFLVDLVAAKRLRRDVAEERAQAEGLPLD